MKNSNSLTVTTLLLAAANLSAATRYVSLESTNPSPPYATWATAATNMQDVVDAAVAGDEIVVTNGTYNRVAVDKPLVLRSVNGPQAALIDGGSAGGCVYLTNGATLVGFTLTNGYAFEVGGGVYCESNAVVSNCVLSGNSADGDFGGAGGGAYGGTLNNCILTGNCAYGGRGACGGGAAYATLNNCTVTGNSAREGDPKGSAAGGGAYACTLNNCTLTGNSARRGGGADSSTLYNCTLTGNSSYRGGGAYSSTLNNSIVYFNTTTLDGPDYDTNSTLNYCCTAPLPTNGVGNITHAPLFVNYAAGNLHLDSHSACVNAGSNDYVSTATDLDGRPRVVGDTVDMGAYEYRALLVSHESPAPTPPYATWATAATNIQDAVDAAVAGDDIVATNGVYSVGEREAFSSEGNTIGFNRVAITNALTLHSINGPEFTIIDGGGKVRCIALSDGASLTGFTLTNGLARVAGGGVWCASTNAFLTNCVIVGNAAPGSKVDMWNFGWGGGVADGTLYNCTLTGDSAGFGGGVFRCVLYNCTLTDNRGALRGGGAAQCTLYNCTLTGNSAPYGTISGYGGGAWDCTLYSCVLTGNWAYYEGGGAAGGALHNCTVVDNTAWDSGGGVTGSALANCIVAYNAAWADENYTPDSTLDYCCTAPLPANGHGNISVPPQFVGYTNGNLRLQYTSPCINAGNNAYVATDTDLDGSPRIVSGTVDIGAYEYQGAGSTISYAWLQQYGLPTNGSADLADADADGLNNWQEWRCGTCPTNASSVLRLLSPQPTGTNVTVTWQSVTGVNYFLECSTNLSAIPSFTCLATNLPGHAGTTSYTDTAATNASPYFYRVGVGN